jgi:superfamily I DNA/RNA helicase
MTSLDPTSEQQAVIDGALSGEHLVIQAGAGSGKTTVLEMAASSLRKPIMYVAFNKTTADDAGKRFPSHTQCRTAHSLAYRAVGYQYKDRLNGPRQPSYAAAKILNTYAVDLGDGVVVNKNPMAAITLDTVRRFCYSADTEIQDHHVPHQNGVNKFKHPLLVETILPWARKAWDDLSGTTGELKFDHDFYLKMWALTKPSLGIDVVMLDEAQDSNPVLVNLIQNQHNSQQIVVGDTFQQMYAWRGSVDALSSWDDAETLYLSQSWRFGQPIADEANKWLDVLGAQLRLSGNPAQESVVVDHLESPHAILCRTNAGALTQVMSLLAQDVSVALVGGGRPLIYLVESLAQLQAGKPTSHPELFIFKDWDQLRAFASEAGGMDLKPVVEMLEKHGSVALLSALNALQTEERATTVVSTAHRAKGREWPSVRIATDFARPDSPDTSAYETPRGEAMVAYVAVTRARQQLDRGGLAWIDDHLPKD